MGSSLSARTSSTRICTSFDSNAKSMMSPIGTLTTFTRFWFVPGLRRARPCVLRAREGLLVELAAREAVGSHAPAALIQCMWCATRPPPLVPDVDAHPVREEQRAVEKVGLRERARECSQLVVEAHHPVKAPVVPFQEAPRHPNTIKHKIANAYDSSHVIVLCAG